MAAKVPTNKAAFVRRFPSLSPADVVDKASAEGLSLTAAYVSQVRYIEKQAADSSSKTGKAKKTRAANATVGRPSASAAYPRHTMEKCIRLPRAILDQMPDGHAAASSLRDILAWA